MANFEFVLSPPPTKNVTPRYGEQDLLRRSASSVPPPARKLTEVAKLIDVSKCIGCKACQVACLEWNNERIPVGENVGSYTIPPDLTPNMFTVMRFTEWVNPETQEPGMADPQGRLHALRRSGLSEGLSGARRHRAVLQRHRRLRPRQVHRLRLLHQRLPVQYPAHLSGRSQGLQVHAVLGSRGGRPGPGLRQGLPDARDRVRHQGGDEAARRGAHHGSQIARLHQCRPLRSSRGQGHARDVRVALTPISRSSMPDCRTTRGSARWSELWKGAAKRYASLAAMAFFVVAAVVHHVAAGPNRSSDEDEEKARQLIEGRDK